MKTLNEIYRQVKIKEFLNSLNEQQVLEYLHSIDEQNLKYIFEHNLVEAKARFNPEILKLKAGVGVDLTPAEKAALEGLNQSVPSRPAADLKPTDLRAKYAKGPKEDPTIAGKSQPAADLKPGDMRSQFAKGPATDTGVAKADATFKDTSTQIGARRAAEKASAETDLRTQARTDAEAKAKRDVTMGDTAKKVAKGGALGLAGTAAYLLTKDKSGQNPAQAGGMDAATRAKTDLAMKVAGAERQTPIAKVGKLPQGNLQLGSKGERVKQLQRDLGIKDDGIFGPQTAAALKNAQKQMGIQSDAKFGTQTQSAMQRAKSMSDLRGANPQLTKVLPGTSAETPVAQKMYQKNYNRDRMESTELSSNRLIEGFKNIMSSGSANLFEAAKKAKKDWDKDGKIESEKDEVWGSRFRAAGIQKEESEAEKAKKKSMSHELDAPSSGGKAPETTTDPDWLKKKKESKVVQTGKNSSTAYKAEEVEFSDAELAHLSSIAEANPIAPVPDDYSGAAGGVSKRDLSDETVAEGIRGMRRKDTKFKDDPKRYSNEYPKSYREPGTMSKAEMRDHIEASVRKYLKSGGKIKKD